MYDGYYSWWSIELYDKEYDPGPLDNNKFGVKTHKSSSFETFSMYGTVKLSLKLNDLIECYAKSRSEDTENVYYKKEVLYVI